MAGPVTISKSAEPEAPKKAAASGLEPFAPQAEEKQGNWFLLWLLGDDKNLEKQEAAARDPHHKDHKKWKKIRNAMERILLRSEKDRLKLEKKVTGKRLEILGEKMANVDALSESLPEDFTAKLEQAIQEGGYTPEEADLIRAQAAEAQAEVAEGLNGARQSLAAETAAENSTLELNRVAAGKASQGEVWNFETGQYESTAGKTTYELGQRNDQAQAISKGLRDETTELAEELEKTKSKPPGFRISIVRDANGFPKIHIEMGEGLGKVATPQSTLRTGSTIAEAALAAEAGAEPLAGAAVQKAGWFTRQVNMARYTGAANIENMRFGVASGVAIATGLLGANWGSKFFGDLGRKADLKEGAGLHVNEARGHLGGLVVGGAVGAAAGYVGASMAISGLAGMAATSGALGATLAVLGSAAAFLSVAVPIIAVAAIAGYLIYENRAAIGGWMTSGHAFKDIGNVLVAGAEFVGKGVGLIVGLGMDVLNPQNLGNLAKGIGVVAGAAWDVATGKISVAEGFQHAADGVGHAMKNTTKALSGIANSTAGQFIGSLAMGAVHMMGDVKIGGRSINEDLADMSAEDPAQAVARKKGSGKKEKLTPDRGLAAAASPQRHPVAMRAVRHPRVSASTMSIEVAANAPAPSFSGPVKKADNDALVVVASGPEPDGGAARDHLGHAHGSNPALALGDGTAG